MRHALRLRDWLRVMQSGSNDKAGQPEQPKVPGTFRLYCFMFTRLCFVSYCSSWHPGQQQIIYKAALWGICADRARKLSIQLTCLWRGLPRGNKCWPLIILGRSYCKKNLMDGGSEVGRDSLVAGMHVWTHQFLGCLHVCRVDKYIDALWVSRHE